MKLRFVQLALIFIMLGGISTAQDVPYVPTPYPVVEEMLAVANVNKNDIVYDLGCGDGRIVVTAAKKFGARGIGIDSNPQRIEESIQNAATNGVTDLVEFKQQDLFKTDLSEATVVTLYLLTHINKKLRPILFEQLKPGTRIVSHAFDMGEWKPEETREVDGRTIYFWRIPENVSGRWELKSSNGGGVVLDLKQEFQEVTGTAQMDGKIYNITESKLDGKNINLTLSNGGKSDVKFSGTISESHLEGNITGMNGTTTEFTAERAPNTQTSLDTGL
jgi:SAM-dependent methyltransferase